MKLFSKCVWIALASCLSSSPLLAEDASVTLVLPDMSCAACPTNVKRALARVDGVKSVDVHAGLLEAVVRYDSSKASVDDLLDMVALVGYRATLKY